MYLQLVAALQIVHLSTVAKAQPILTGPSVAACPGDLLTFTCEADRDDFGNNIIWTAARDPMMTGTIASQIASLNTEGTVVMFIGSFIATAIVRITSMRMFSLQLNASTSLDGAQIRCVLPVESNAVNISIRGPAMISSLIATPDSSDPLSTTLSWSSSPPADNYTVTVTPTPPTNPPLTTTDTTLMVSLSYNTLYTLSVSGTVCGLMGDSLNINYTTIVRCYDPEIPGNGTVGTESERGEGAMITFQCNRGFSPFGVRISVCTSEGTWSPDPGSFQCTEVTCPPLMMPVNGSGNFSTGPSPVDSTIYLQCDDGLFPPEVMLATCQDNGEWSTDLSQLVCRTLPVTCPSSPRQPANGMIVNLDNINTREGSVITFQCDPGFSLVGEGTATCNNSGLWHPDPALIECLIDITTLPTPSGGGNAAVAGGVAAGGVLVVILIILGILALCLVFRTKRKKGSASISKTPAGPYYEEVDLSVPVSRGQNIQMESNEAYGQVKPAHALQHNIELQSNDAYGQLR